MSAYHRDNQTTKAAFEILHKKFGKRATMSQAIRDQHGHGEGWYPTDAPDMVIFVKNTEEVAEIMKTAAAYKIPIIPFGTGTSLEGHVNAVNGGICIDLSEMDHIIEVNAEDLDCRVQAGVRRKALNVHLRDTGLFFPIDPGADASIGGMTATRASGTNAVRYGTMRDNVRGLTIVTPRGEIIKTGGRYKKSSAGYDLTSLYIGSEGTLGIITEIQLRLYGIPQTIMAGVCQFPDLDAAVQTTILTIQSGIPVARIELLDKVQMDACIQYSKLTQYDAKPTLFFEFHGSPNSIAEQTEDVGAIANEFGGSAFTWATTTEDRALLWEARHNAFYAACALAPNKKGMATDACVPISNLAECILETQKDVEASGFLAPIVGHVGDGNFHLSLLFDPEDSDEIKRAKELVDRLNHRAIGFGGTCTGEHGIGLGKQRFMEIEHGRALGIMRQLKTALDPDNIMNPGKILPDNDLH